MGIEHMYLRTVGWSKCLDKAITSTIALTTVCKAHNISAAKEKIDILHCWNIY